MLLGPIRCQTDVIVTNPPAENSCRHIRLTITPAHTTDNLTALREAII
jgi:hypothetical protein